MILAGMSLALTCWAQTAAAGKPVSFQMLVRDAKMRIKEISVEELRALAEGGQKYVLIDVREDNEWAVGRAAGAIHVGRGVLDRDIAGKVPQTDARIILYCGGGFRSALAADTLQKMGYTNVASLAGGFAAYQKLGLAVEK